MKSIEKLVFDDKLVEIARKNDRQALKEYEAECVGKATVESIEMAFLLLRYLKIQEMQPDQDVVNEEYEKLMNKVSRKYSVRRYSLWLSGAACFLALFLTLFQSLKFRTNTDVEVFSMLDSLSVVPKEVQIISGELKAFVADDMQIEQSEEGNILVEGKEQINADDIHTEFVQIVVPKGKHTSVRFNDGTMAWVNSGTKLLYPKVFNSKKREIYVDGEIYIEVEKTPRNTPFIVHVKSFDVEVLGTKFNVNAYQEDIQKSVVLVEGLVEVKMGKETKQVQPGQGCFLRKGEIDLKYVDTEIYTAWKNGFMKVVGESVGDIMLRLSRYYGVQINCSDSLLLQEKYFGKLELNDSLENVLYRLSLSTPFVSEINEEDGTIMILKKK